MALPLLDKILSAGKTLGKNIQTGYRRGAQIVEERSDSEVHTRKGRGEASMFHPNFYKELVTGAPERAGYETSTDPATGAKVYKKIVLPAEEGIKFRENPVQFLSAYVPHIATDLESNASRGVMWLNNHPLPLIDKIQEAALGKDYKNNYTRTQRSLIGLAGITPVVASMGTFDIFNPGQVFRSKGYAQEYSDVGTDDRRETEEPVQETIQRLIMGRQGSTLKFETAQEDIPDLTKERYDNYQRFRYNDKGLLDLGILKATGENLQGVPEARWFGFPVNIPTAGAVAGGIVGGRMLAHGKPPGTLGAVARVGGGAMAGAMLGNFVNELIATANRPKLPDLKSYEQQYSIDPVDYSQRGIG